MAKITLVLFLAVVFCSMYVSASDNGNSGIMATASTSSSEQVQKAKDKVQQMMKNMSENHSSATSFANAHVTGSQLNTNVVQNTKPTGDGKGQAVSMATATHTESKMVNGKLETHTITEKMVNNNGNITRERTVTK